MPKCLKELEYIIQKPNHLHKTLNKMWLYHRNTDYKLIYTYIYWLQNKTLFNFQFQSLSLTSIVDVYILREFVSTFCRESIFVKKYLISWRAGSCLQNNVRTGDVCVRSCGDVTALTASSGKVRWRERGWGGWGGWDSGHRFWCPPTTEIKWCNRYLTTISMALLKIEN